MIFWAISLLNNFEWTDRLNGSTILHADSSALNLLPLNLIINVILYDSTEALSGSVTYSTGYYILH